MAPVEGFVQVNPDSTGKQVRNLQVQVQQTDGSFATVLMQVVAIVDPATGIALNLDDSSRLDETNRLLRCVVRGLEVLTETQLLSDSDTSETDDVSDP